MTLYATVEIMGRRTRAGVISDAQIGGATLLRIEHPSRANFSGAEPLTEYYAPQAIFAIRPCSQEEAEKVAAWAWPAAHSVPELDPAFLDACDVGDGDDLDDDAEPF
jgi:hypothetical protein